MGTFIKYLLYIVLAIVLYVVVKGFYVGEINSTTTLGELAVQVDNETKDIAKETIDAIEK